MNTRMYNPSRKGKNDIKELNGLAKHMDVIILYPGVVIYHKTLEDADTIFIHTGLLLLAPVKFFVTNILPKLNHPVNVIISGGDVTFPNNTDLRHTGIIKLDQNMKTLGLHPHIKKLFVENLDEDIPNTLPIPLGVNWSEGPVTMDFFSKFVNIDPSKPLLCTNFNRVRNGKGQWSERRKVFDLCETAWKPFMGVNENTTTHEEFLEKMGKNAFTICVHGGGLDVNPKLWEALLIGVIPIIRENKPYTDIYVREDFPVVIVKGWKPHTINARKLQRWHKKYYPYFTDPQRRDQLLTRLSLEYWVNYVRADHCA